MVHGSFIWSGFQTYPKHLFRPIGHFMERMSLKILGRQHLWGVFTITIEILSTYIPSFQIIRWLLVLNKYWFGIGLGVGLLVVGAFFYRTQTYVPFVHPRFAALRIDHQSKFVALNSDANRLDHIFPTIQSVTMDTLDDYLEQGYIALLPWDFHSMHYRALPMNDVLFYEDSLGAITVPMVRKTRNLYNDFLEGNVTLTSAGTVVLARGVAQAIERTNDILLPWNDTNQLLQNADIALVNFKSPLVNDYEAPVSRWRLIGPSRYVKGLVQSGIDLVSISGNHMGDAGVEGLTDTMAVLNQSNIQYVGAGMGRDAYACKRTTQQNHRFGFLAFNNVTGSIGPSATNKMGIAWLNNHALDAVQACNELVDTVVVLVNWGVEYQHIPRDVEIEWSQQLINHGADIIIGDQAHWVQSTYKQPGIHVSYGLGNYIFDQHWSKNTKEGIIQTHVFYNKKLHYTHAYPTQLQPDGRVIFIDRLNERYTYVLSKYYTHTDRSF